MSGYVPMASRAPRQFDPSSMNYSALTAPVGPGEIRDFKLWAKTSSPFRYPTAVGARMWGAFDLRGFVAAAFIALFVWVMLAVVAAGTPGRFSDAMFVPLAISGPTILFALIALILLSWDFRSKWKRWMRLHRFGNDNGLFFLPESNRPPLSGTLFNGPRAGSASERLVSQTGRRFEVGNYDTEHTDLANRVRGWGYMAIGLDRSLPHIMLKSRKNARRRRSIPVVVTKSQALSLEGDFNKYFTLYAPREYARDALYVFAPDLMALMIDEVAHLEVEIIDDWIFFYSPKPFDLTSRRTIRRLMRIARIVGAKTFRQTERYFDDRTGAPFAANEVGSGGRRLRTRVSILAVIGVVLWVAFQLLRFIHPFGN